MANVARLSGLVCHASKLLIYLKGALCKNWPPIKFQLQTNRGHI